MGATNSFRGDLLRALETGAGGRTSEDWDELGWSLEDQTDEVLIHYWAAVWGGTPVRATDRQIAMLEEAIACGDLPEADEFARARFERMDPEMQAKHEQWLYEHREWLAGEADRVAGLVRDYVDRLLSRQDEEHERTIRATGVGSLLRGR